MTPDEDKLILAGATGGYREFRPSRTLDGHFRCIWCNTFRRHHGGHLAVVPDGCVDIVWIDGELTVAGPDVAVAVSQIFPGSTVIGMRFRPGAARKWLGLPMSEIVGRRVALGDLWGARARKIATAIADAATTARRMRVLDAALCRLGPDLELPPSDMGFVFDALEKVSAAGRGMSIILDRLEVSPRTLRRRCQETFGYGPKTLECILRFQRFLRLASRVERPRLADLAFDAGYADQAHLTREVRRLSGLSPATVLSQLHP